MVAGSTTTFLLALVFFVLWCFIWAICLLGWRTARLRHKGKTLPSRLASQPPSSVPGVTIIRPLCGLDQNLYNTLEAGMKLDYPKYEMIFALQEEGDEALPVVRQIMERYKEVDCRLIIDNRNVGVNPKINNLMTPFEQAKYDLLWVLDSTISIHPGALGRAVDAFLGTTLSSTSTSSFEHEGLESTRLMAEDVRPPPSQGDVGLVHHVPFAIVYQRTWGSLVEQAFLNTTHAKMYLAINAAAVDSCVMGKSNLYSKANIATLTTPSPTLRSLPDPPTGLEAFSPFLAEDNMIALSLWHQLHLKHAMTPDVALDFLGSLTLMDYINRRVRWLRVRKKMTPLIAVLIEPFTESIICGIYGSWAMARLFGVTAKAIWVVHMVVWLIIDLGVRDALGSDVGDLGGGGGGRGWGFVLGWTVREVLALPVWVWGMMSSEVVWRGKRYRIMNSGRSVFSI